MIDIPHGLKHAIETGNCVLFLGAGAGFNLSQKPTGHAPLAQQLATDLAGKFSIPTSSKDLSRVARVVEIRKGRSELENYIRGRLSNLEPDNFFRSLTNYRWKAIFTTNYDNGIQRAYALNPNPPQHPVTITHSSGLVPVNFRLQIPIYHLHGSLFAESEPDIIITPDDYSKFREKRRMMFEILKNQFATSTILYIGYSHQDSNWSTVFTEIKDEFYPSKLPRSYRISPGTDELDKEIFSSQNIETIDGTLEDFSTAAKIGISLPNNLETFIGGIRHTVPTDLQAAFDKNPAAVTRLLSSWTYVNQAAFDGDPKMQSFLKGDRATWALIASNQVFERDIEEDVYNDLLDYITSSRQKPNVKCLLGAAGYGTSTLMMRLAMRLVNENAGPVYILSPSKTLLEGDIEFALSLTNETPIFFVDNAADYATELDSVLTRLRESGLRAQFFLGERLNEWRQARTPFHSKEYELDPLSDSEIDCLLEYLEKHSALNQLEALTPDLRFEAIKQKHGKDLLVVMRESTEGKSFDAILEDEYRGIRSSKARSLYLTVCCFHQHGINARERLIADVMGVTQVQLHNITSNATEGVIIHETLDEENGVYAMRARHRIIAAVVWERCGSSGERESIIQKSIDALNLNYWEDKKAFDEFIRSNRLVDSIQTVEGRIRFFDKACQKDPKSPYVRQHYARMLLRAGLTTQALQQINDAIDLNSNVKILYHTKGHILSEIALKAESIDIGRRRLVQSEDSFKQVLRMRDSDGYAYHGLAKLYFDWARHLPNTNEQTDYIAKAEEIISEGLKNARRRDSLWIVSSEIQGWLGDNQDRILALEKAVEESPNSIQPRFLLGRAYRKQGLYEKSVDILKPTLQSDLNEDRIAVEYAVSLLLQGNPYNEAIAILNLSTLYGYSNPRFIATLGGAYFLNHDFTLAKDVFNRAKKRTFTSRQLNSIEFAPANPKNPNESYELIGTIVSAKSIHAWIQTNDFPRIYIRRRTSNGDLLQLRDEVRFNLAFNVNGPLAIKAEILK